VFSRSLGAKPSLLFALDHWEIFFEPRTAEVGLAVWSALFLILPDLADRYRGWQIPYLGFLPIAIAFERRFFLQFAGESRISRDSLAEGVEFELSGDFLNGQ
jgi:hypothetical protein